MNNVCVFVVSGIGWIQTVKIFTVNCNICSELCVCLCGVRHLLDPDNPAHEARAAELLQEMLVQLNSKVKELQGDDFLIIRIRLQQSCTEFQVQLDAW